MPETSYHPAIDYPESDGQSIAESDATRDYLSYCLAVLQSFFRSRRNIYVSGNLFIYYREGDPKSVISPDVFVIFGVSKRKRRSYRTWQEGGKLPSFVMEITSLTTRRNDEVDKRELYAQLGVEEYFQYDPTSDYLNPQLKGSRLVNDRYEPLPLQTVSNAPPYIYSHVLGLDLILRPPTVGATTVPSLLPLSLELRFRDPRTNEILLTYHELDVARQEAEQARLQAETAREEAEQSRRLAATRLLALGLTAEQVAEALDLPVEDIRSSLE